MKSEVRDVLYQLNPWLQNSSSPIFDETEYFHRIQIKELLETEWDKYWTLLIGPRRSGKTTLGTYLSKQLIGKKRFSDLLYLNCDYKEIREWLSSPLFIKEALAFLKLKKPILFIDEVQRLANPGLLLKAIIDLKLPMKHIATGSSQLEIRSKLKESLMGRQFNCTVLPFSQEEYSFKKNKNEYLLYGSYPQVVLSNRKEIQLKELYERYIQQDIIEILKVNNVDVMQKLMTLIAHNSGQLVNYSQLSIDCKVSIKTIQHYLSILEQTYVISKITPFVGNKRTEITKNPIYYFIDNGFRNIALNNFTSVESRMDLGLLIENFVYQELLKHKVQHFMNYNIHYWRTTTGAEVDFVLYSNQEQFIPIEVKYRNMNKPIITRGFRSFIQAYQPKQAIIISKNQIAQVEIENCIVNFIPLNDIINIFNVIDPIFT